MRQTLLPVSLLISVVLVPPLPAVPPGIPGALQAAADTKAVAAPAGTSGARSAPRTSPGPTTADGAAKGVTPTTTGEPVNVNSAGVKDLMTLEGVGRGVAERIVQYRTTHGPFKKLDELRHVQGVGARVLERNRERIVVK